MFYDIDDVVMDKQGWMGKVVPMPDDYSFASKDDPYTMARLVYVKFAHISEPILIPESRLRKSR